MRTMSYLGMSDKHLIDDLEETELDDRESTMIITTIACEEC